MKNNRTAPRSPSSFGDISPLLAWAGLAVIVLGSLIIYWLGELK